MIQLIPTALSPKIDSTYLCEYILTQVEKFGPVSHLKLQKLLYYVQAYHLAYFDIPIIEDQFQAWVHGPVSRKIYNEIRDYSVLHGSITYKQEEGEQHPSDRIAATLTKDQIELIDDVLAEYGPMTAYALERETHSETPWIEARHGYGPAERCETIIKDSTMKSFYKQFLYGQEQNQPG